MKRTLIIALAVAFASTSSGGAFAASYLGNVSTFVFNFCPKNWLPADGRLLAISQNTALFSLYGTTYGGNGTTNFALPKVSVMTAPYNGPAQKLTTCVVAAGAFPSRP